MKKKVLLTVGIALLALALIIFGFFIDKENIIAGVTFATTSAIGIILTAYAAALGEKGLKPEVVKLAAALLAFSFGMAMCTLIMYRTIAPWTPVMMQNARVSLGGTFLLGLTLLGAFALLHTPKVCWRERLLYGAGGIMLILASLGAGQMIGLIPIGKSITNVVEDSFGISFILAVVGLLIALYGGKKKDDTPPTE